MRGPQEQWEVAAVISEFYGRVETAGDYATGMWGVDMTPDVRDEVTNRLLSAIANAYVLGQLVAMPSLAESKRELAKTLEDNRVFHRRRAQQAQR